MSARPRPDGDADFSLKALLVCPACRSVLRWSGVDASCRTCGRSYPSEGGVARLVVGAEHGERRRRGRRLPLLETAYDVVQRLVGFERTGRRLRDALGDTTGRVVLDVGGGTGNLIPFLSAGTTYVNVDNDPAKIERLHAKWPAVPAVLGDVTRLPFANDSVDDAVCVAVTHHLADEGLAMLVDELARVARERVVVCDPVLDARSRRGLLLWRIDRGSHPRTADDLAGALERGLARTRASRFAVHHHYLLWVGARASRRVASAAAVSRDASPSPHADAG